MVSSLRVDEGADESYGPDELGFWRTPIRCTELPVTSYQLPVSGVTSYKLPVMGCRCLQLAVAEIRRFPVAYQLSRFSGL